MSTYLAEAGWLVAVNTNFKPLLPYRTMTGRQLPSALQLAPMQLLGSCGLECPSRLSDLPPNHDVPCLGAQAACALAWGDSPNHHESAPLAPMLNTFKVLNGQQTRQTCRLVVHCCTTRLDLFWRSPGLCMVCPCKLHDHQTHCRNVYGPVATWQHHSPIHQQPTA